MLKQLPAGFGSRNQSAGALRPPPSKIVGADRGRHQPRIQFLLHAVDSLRRNQAVDDRNAVSNQRFSHDLVARVRREMLNRHVARSSPMTAARDRVDLG